MKSNRNGRLKLVFSGSLSSVSLPAKKSPHGNELDSLICLAVDRLRIQRTADGMTTDRRILFFLTYLSGRRSLPNPADRGQDDNRQTKYVLFDYLSGCSEPADRGRTLFDLLPPLTTY